MTITADDLPIAALDDYAEHQRQGGHWDLATWWAYYKDAYVMTINADELPSAAVDDYAEYRRRGGRNDLATWWSRHNDNYAPLRGGARFCRITKGDEVTGDYLGTPFTGTVRHVRWHTIRHDVREVTVEVPAGWEYDGIPRTSILVYVDPNGCPTDYDGRSTSLQVVASAAWEFGWGPAMDAALQRHHDRQAVPGGRQRPR